MGIGPKGIDLAGDSEGKRKWGPKLRPRSWACLHQKQEPLILMGDKAEREYPAVMSSVRKRGDSSRYHHQEPGLQLGREGKLGKKEAPQEPSSSKEGPAHFSELVGASCI